MPDKPVNKAQFFENPYNAYCEVFNCTTRAKWFIGRPDAPHMTCLNLCDECAKDIARYLPTELVEFVPLPEGKVLVDVAELEELRRKAAELDALDAEIEAESGQESDVKAIQEIYCDFPGCRKGPFKSPQALIAHQRVHKGAGK